MVLLPLLPDVADPAFARDSPVPRAGTRVSICGKFLFAGDTKLVVRGVTYGPFASGSQAGGWDPATVAADFAAMRAAGINAVRLYTVPPRWLLDAALEHGLWVMAGIPWEQHVAFLDEGLSAAIIERVREGAAACAGHPALLCIAVGNEIPAPMVRWLGRRRVERFLGRLCDAARRGAPGALVTYVNYPSTEYLRVADADFVSFNVYLEARSQLESYIARLQNLADDRPLVIAELGFDSQRNGQARQADTLGWQLDCAYGGGCAGAFVFAWTDEWHRGGHEILDWDFGLTTRDRGPKPALAAVADRFDGPVVPAAAVEPEISVVVCTYNGAATLADCLDGVTALNYPRYEVIVVVDGSTDASADIARTFGVRVICTDNRGLSAARNTGLHAALGEIVAYIDDDARPDADWLTHIARGFEDGTVAAVGGPNIIPPGSGTVAQCVANAPGGPTHVLISDREAEHLPGCNLAIRRSSLEAIGGFDERFRVAGDDVDVCWRLTDAGQRLAFSAGAVVLHRRRATIRGYLRQQRGYGRAEAHLERKWPERYSPVGHVSWVGRIYGNGSAQHRGGMRWRVYYGAWGSGAFQPLYGPRHGILRSLPLLPEWYLGLAGLAALSAGGALWSPLLAALPLLALALGALAVDAVLGAARAHYPGISARRRIGLRALTALLYLLHPPARLRGRLGSGLAPWRRRGPRGAHLPLPRTFTLWSEQWAPAEAHVDQLASRLRAGGVVVTSGGDWDRWDLHIRGGTLGGARVRTAVEEHGSGRQLTRVRCVAQLTAAGAVAAALAIVTVIIAALIGGALAAALPLGAGAAIGLRLGSECGSALQAAALALRDPAPEHHDEPGRDACPELRPLEASG